MTIKVQNTIGLDSNTLKWGKYKFISETSELILQKELENVEEAVLRLRITEIIKNTLVNG